MDANFYRIVLLVSILELVISNRNTERHVEVTESNCNRTYRFNRWRKMTLEYYNTYVYFEENQPKPVCYLNIVNNDKDKSICIKYNNAERYDVDSFLYLWHQESCIKMFRYFIGYLPYHLENGYTCSDFKYTPMCTDKSEVYAVFNDVEEYLSMPAKVEIFTKGKYDPITTKRPTTPYWYDNNDDDDYDNYSNSMDTATMMKIVFGTVCVLVFLFTCCACGKVKQSSSTNANGGFNQLPNQQSNYHSVNQQMHTEDAPSYDTLMRQQQTHIDGDGTAWQIHDPVFVGGGRLGPMNTPTAPVASVAMNTPTVPVAPTPVIEPTAPEIPPFSTNLPSNNDQPTPYNNSNEPIVNQSLPSVPPPSYDELDFKSPPPPPYIGQGE
ncbi:hypothetical protein ACF0H5_011975 [Mactra antiquata]